MLFPASRRIAFTPKWARNILWRTARAMPSLDQPFANTKSLTDAVTGQSLVTFTRASSGRYVGSDGVLQTAVTNLLLRSEEFDNASWTKLNCSASQNTVIAPNGTLTAETITASTSDGVAYQDVSGLQASTSYTFSIYLRADTTTNLTIYILTTGFVTLSSQAITATSSWQRFSVTANSGANTTLRVSIGAGNTFSSPETVYAWGAQLEQSSTVGEYIPTTSTINSAPRFDHNPTTGESLGLLVEEQRTNSIRNNTMVGAVAGTPGTLPTNWSIGGNSGLTYSVIGTGTDNGIQYIDIRFNGTTAAIALPESTITFEPSTAVAAVQNQTWTGSAYLKIVGGSLSGIIGGELFVIETNISGALTGASSSTYNYSQLTGVLPSCRVSHTRTLTGATTAFVVNRVDINFIAGGGSVVDCTLRIGLPQLEQGAFATSVIPTTGTAATRSADVASITGSNFGTTRTNLLVRSEELDNASWVKLNNVTVTANATTAPNGFITADKIVEPASSADKPIVQSVTLIANTTYTASVYFKAAERPTILFHVRKSDYSTRFGGFFNTSTNVFTTDTSGGGVLDSFTFTNVGGNWYRCSITGNIGANTAGIVTVYLANSSNNLTYTGDGTSGLFLWGAQLEVGAAVTPYIQSPSVFVSRASSGTYIGGNGVLQTAVTNLCLQSENFTTTWTNFLSTDAANTAIAPNGTLTADTLIPDSGATTGLIRQDFSGTTFTDNASISFSIYVKAAGLTNFNIQFFNKANTFYGTQTVNASTGGLSGSGTIASTTVTNVGDGWYRVSMTGISAGSGATGPNVRIVVTSTGDGTSGIYIWGAQLEQSSTVGEYIPTTSTINSAARYDHDPISLIGKGLLLEEARTNLLLQSADISNIYWVKSETTVTANAITAPDGTTTAGKLVESINNTQHTLASAVISWAGNTQYTATFFAKAGERSKFDILLGTAANWVNSERVATFDLANGTVYFGPNSPAVASITPFANNWFRCRVTATTTATPSASSVFIRMCDNTGLASYQGIANYGIYLWGAQLEAGAFPTSYIPTTTATVTRAADVSTSVATSVFESSWYRQDEGTFYADVFRQFAVPATDFPVVADCRTGTNINQFSYLTEALAGTYVAISGVSQAELYPGGLAGVRNRRLAHGYAANNFAATANGSIPLTDTSGSVPTVNAMSIGSVSGNAQSLNGTIRRLVFFPQRLPNSTIQALTQ